MDSKLYITFAGDVDLFHSLETNIVEALPQESVEWRRSYGRPPKPVHVEANFVAFSEHKLPKEGEIKLLDQPYLHTYWTDCCDQEIYRLSVRDDIIAWLTKLRKYNVYDWMIIVVEHIDSKRSNKSKLLPRATVLDKLKSDFQSKNSERCIDLLDPFRSDTRAAESWQNLLQRLRQLLLHAYTRQLTQYEEHVRAQRERRNEPGWSFVKFFFFQEELAYVFEMLGLYEEALVQYDELDALFTQFVINSASGDMPEWLVQFTCCCDTWSGLCLLKERAVCLRNKLMNQQGSLLDLRNYLFSRQCSLLLLLCRPWEMAQRTLPFLHNCVQELRILEVSMVPGSVACWVFLSCLEILMTCERFNDSSQVEAYSLYTASLWAYARVKLKELGELCGLMPHLSATSEQLHMVVGLLSGMEEDPYVDVRTPQSPQEKLREALSSRESFQKHYLELSELSMGTFKHIGRIRSARLIGKDLAYLYMKLGEPQKAVSFLQDMLKKYIDEKWDYLADLTRQDIANCYKAMDDMEKFVKVSVEIAASQLLPEDERKKHFHDVCTGKVNLIAEKSIDIHMDNILRAEEINITSPDPVLIDGSEVEICLKLYNLLPSAIDCQKVWIPVLHSSKPMPYNSPVKSGPKWLLFEDEPPPKGPPKMAVHYYRARNNGSCNTIGIVCYNLHQVLFRQDIHNHYQNNKTVSVEESDLDLTLENIRIYPGENILNFKMQISDAGFYVLKQLCATWDNICFVLPKLLPQFSLEVVFESPKVDIKWIQGELLAGLEQNVQVVVTSGSKYLESNTTINLKSSRGLLLKANDHFSEECTLSLPSMEPFDSISKDIQVLANLGPQRDAQTICHQVIMTPSWDSNSCAAKLHFLPPFTTQHRLFTCNERKYIQIVLQGFTKEVFNVMSPELTPVDHDSISLKSLNTVLDSLKVSTEHTAFYLWEMTSESSDPIKFKFSLQYSYNSLTPLSDRTYNYEFRLENYSTLYGVKVKIEPTRASEFCRVDNVCNMHVTIVQLNLCEHTSLMYEVVADQSSWSVIGRTAGVINLNRTDKYAVMLEVKPLVRGFLPLPTVRLSKYIPSHLIGLKDVNKPSTAKLEPFFPGQVYNWSRAMQVHVLASTSASAPASEALSL